MIDKEDSLPVTRQCEILELSRSGIYYNPSPISAKDVELMRQIDEIHLMYPFYGSRNIRNELWGKGYDIGRDRVRRLMRRMGIEALYVKPRLSLPHPGHVKYPYLLRGLEITKANHVWSTDITYIPMARGFCYLVAIMDWASRMVLAWRLSNTLDSAFCVVSSQQKHLRTPFVQTILPSVWMARVAGETTSLSNGYGRASSTRTFILKHMRQCRR
jgi:putative transposase